MAAEEQICIICEKPVIYYWFNLSKRGLETILKFCSLRNDKRVEEYLMEHGLDVVMHNKCRKDYTNEKRLSNDHVKAITMVSRLRSCLNQL
jgi:hypothetical protein